MAYQRNLLPELVRLIENFFLWCIDNKIFTQLIINEDYENLLINFLLRIDNNEKRKNLILIILFLLNEQSIVLNKHISKYASVSIKILSKDSELIGGVINFFDKNFINQINKLINAQKINNK